ncbi:PREDICTED: phospholipase A2 inhibitor 25 kDa subunit-like [Nanorana parkeri]|uniref:phospholipase A2 inhibitor 25 kDa subunit-like n=1 Tax=Nanorana parkeri TaxID=125878 RepID=UPI0008549343|nr:PREDICTED: phospholipase A2 inhibitor 25 kDa subunit-like [Nanorana parkeri]
MRSILELLCVLSAFTATGYSLTCKLCVGQGSSSCIGTSETCPPDHGCGAVHTVTKIDEKEMNIYLISCVPVKKCNTPGSISITNGKIRRGTSCCHTSNCIPPAPKLPADDKQANGLFCGTCVTEASDNCSAEEMMECTGKEDMCLFQTSVTTGDISVQEALRGCSTKSYCDLSKQSVKSTLMNVETTYSCTPGQNRTVTAPPDPENEGNSNGGRYPSVTLITMLLLFLLCSKW